MDKFDTLTIVAKPLAEVKAAINIGGPSPDLIKAIEGVGEVLFGLIMSEFALPVNDEADSLLNNSTYQFNPLDAQSMRDAPYSDPVKGVLLARWFLALTSNLSLSSVRMPNWSRWANRVSPIVIG